MSSKLSFTDINSWYTSLNTLKNKENINLGSETAPNLNQAQIRATDINTYINKLNALRTNEYFRHADWITITTVSSKDQIRDILKQNINTEIANLDKVCANFSVTTSNATFGFKTSFSAGSCSTNITDATTRCITNQTSSCKTNGTSLFFLIVEEQQDDVVLLFLPGVMQQVLGLHLVLIQIVLAQLILPIALLQIKHQVIIQLQQHIILVLFLINQ